MRVTRLIMPPRPILARDAAIAAFCEEGYARADDHGLFEIRHGYVGDLLVYGFVGSNDWRDWIVNCDRTLVDAPEFDCMLHRGYRDLWRDTGASFRILNAGYRLSHDGPVMICGHSLGGALAQVAALDLVRSGALDAAQIELVTFGAPRIWGSACAASYPVEGRHYRFGWDPISLVPLRGASPPRSILIPGVARGLAVSWWQRLPWIGDHGLPHYVASLDFLAAEVP